MKLLARCAQYGAKDPLTVLYPSCASLITTCSKPLCFSPAKTRDGGAERFWSVSASLTPPQPPRTGAGDEAWTLQGAGTTRSVDSASETRTTTARRLVSRL